MSEYSQIVCDLLEARRSEPSATEVFMKLKHDKDLCPGFRSYWKHVDYAALNSKNYNFQKVSAGRG